MLHSWSMTLADDPPITSVTVLLTTLVLGAWGLISVLVKRAFDRNEVLEDRLTVDQANLVREQTQALTNTNTLLLRVLQALDERDERIASKARAEAYAEMAKNRRAEDSG